MQAISAQLTSAKSPLIIGSCISYDFARTLLNDKSRYKYIWRVSTPSLMTDRPNSDPIFDISNFTDDEKRIFSIDFYKEFDLRSKLKSTDIVVMDFFRDIYDFIRFDKDIFVTRGPEYWSHSLLGKEGGELIRAGTREHSEIWLRYADLFSLKYNAYRPAQSVILNCSGVNWVHGGRSSIDNTQFDILEIRRKNYILTAMCNYMHSKLDGSILIEYDAWRSAANINHDWGPGPVHLTLASVKSAIEEIPLAIARSTVLFANSEDSKSFRDATALHARSQLIQVERFD